MGKKEIIALVVCAALISGGAFLAVKKQKEQAEINQIESQLEKTKKDLQKKKYFDDLPAPAPGEKG